ncbi:MAG: peptide chain release factor N(5)-glutamine methyltransferase [Deltaproteobacteria bacterium]|nr:peptide chain release factor N(5)-glutamine methyltransferase [Deltaproteobacteria bacterium]
MTTLQKIVVGVEETLGSYGVPAPKREALLMLSTLLGIKPGAVFFKDGSLLNARAEVELNQWLKRRKKREPLNYITGECDFWSLTFMVTPKVLIPRPETEQLVEETLLAVKDKKTPLILDLCTGSGCVGISIASELKDSRLVATDLSSDALAIAKANAEKNKVSSQIDYLEGNLFEALDKRNLALSFDVITSNPPYINSADIDGLAPEVSVFEPRISLDGGTDGLILIRKIINDAPKFLKPGGTLLMEFGFGQAKDILNIVEECKAFEEVETLKDLSGIERVLRVKKKIKD